MMHSASTDHCKQKLSKLDLLSVIMNDLIILLFVTFYAVYSYNCYLYIILMIRKCTLIFSNELALYMN